MQILNMHIYKLLGRYKSEEIIKLMDRWFPEKEFNAMLKTDLNEEAYGEDQILFSLSDKYGHKYGLDINFMTVHQALFNNKRFCTGNRHHYLTADVCSLPIMNESFDLIVSISTLDHFRNPDELIKCLKELQRVLKKGGHFILALNNKHNRNFYWSLKIGKTLRLIRYPLNFYSEEEVEKKLKFSGFTVLEMARLINIISPINYFCLFLNKLLPERIVDYIAKPAIKRDNSKFAWFIVAKCKKD